MYILNKTTETRLGVITNGDMPQGRLITLSGVRYNGKVTSIVKLKLNPGYNEVSEDDFKTIDTNYLAALEAAGMIEVVKNKPNSKPAKKSKKPKSTSSVNTESDAIDLVTS